MELPPCSTGRALRFERTGIAHCCNRLILRLLRFPLDPRSSEDLTFRTTVNILVGIKAALLRQVPAFRLGASVRLCCGRCGGSMEEGWWGLPLVLLPLVIVLGAKKLDEMVIHDLLEARYH